jgi:ATP-binding protein involved in chromosome partitioning
MHAEHLNEARVLAALDTVQDPELGRSLVAAGMIHDVRIDGGAVTFTLELTSAACPLRDALRTAAEQAVHALPGVTSVSVEMTARPARPQETLLPEVRHVIAVASGKGGVGKSTVAANLAVALADTGARVGLLDLDIYGPSIPLLFDVNEPPEGDPETNKVLPIEREGVALMSLGFLLDPDAPVIWRGPMVAGAVGQLLRDVAWGALDYLIIDLPPGTGDAQLSLAQLVPLTGVVIVTTAQDAALTIAVKALRMFQHLRVPVLGVVENMSRFHCPHCGEETPVFGEPGAAETAARRLRVPFLGRIPLVADIVAAGDAGRPTVAAAPDSPQGQAFRAVADAVANQAHIAATLRAGCGKG